MNERKKGSAVEKASASPVVRIEGYFVERHKERYGFPPIVSYGKDRSLIKKLIEQWGEDDVRQMVDAFFAATRIGGLGYSEVRRMRYHNIGDFYAGAQIIRRLQQAGEVSDRTASNAHEIAKAMGRRSE